MLELGNVLSCSGDQGDVQYACPTLRALAADVGPIDLVLFPSKLTRERMTEAKAMSLGTLLIHQPYIQSVSFSAQPAGVNMDVWRKRMRPMNLAENISLSFDCVPSFDPWLVVPDPRPVASLVVHRSPRYRNIKVLPTWRSLLANFAGDVVFVGSRDEHEEFCRNVGQVDYYETPTYLDLAQVIAGCELFMGNQSSPMSVAIGLGVDLVQEVCVGCPNCIFPSRKNHRYVK